MGTTKRNPWLGKLVTALQSFSKDKQIIAVCERIETYKSLLILNFSIPVGDAIAVALQESASYNALPRHVSRVSSQSSGRYALVFKDLCISLPETLSSIGGEPSLSWPHSEQNKLTDILQWSLWEDALNWKIICASQFAETRLSWAGGRSSWYGWARQNADSFAIYKHFC